MTGYAPDWAFSQGSILMACGSQVARNDMKSELLGEILIKEGLVNGEQLEQGLAPEGAQAGSGEKLGAALIRLGFLSDPNLLKALSIQLGIPYILKEDYPPAPPSLERHPTVKFLKQYKVVPVGLDDGVLKLASASPRDPYPVEAIGAFTGLPVDVVLGLESDIMNAIESYYCSGGVTMENIIEGISDREVDGDGYDDVEHLKDMALEAPIINLVNLFLTGAVDKNASDIHIEPFEDSLLVRYRIDGILYLVETLPRKLHPAIASRIKIMAKLNIAERRLPQDGRIKVKPAGRVMDIRVSTIPTMYGESIVMRLLDASGFISMEGVGFSSHNLKAFEDLIRQPHGMILVTGPTGSGKSTTLYSALGKIKTSEKKIITIEDPIEYNIEGVNQMQVKSKIGLTFANGLRSIVRQDPDVIMVGEIRDSETADIAIHAALTGHLILSTVHTNDAPGTAARLIDMGIESYLISSSLIGVLAQRLVRRICKHCREPYHPGAEELSSLGDNLTRLRNAAGGQLQAFKGRGCAECGGTGYKGRIGIFELMVINDEIGHMIAEKKSARLVRKAALEQGMVPLLADGWEKVLAGITTIDEVSRVTLDLDTRMDKAAI